MTGTAGGGEASRALFERALESMPGGVNSPVRAFGGVGGTPVVFERGEGAYLVDVDGRRYVDHVMSWGALILGHGRPRGCARAGGGARPRDELRCAVPGRGPRSRRRSDGSCRLSSGFGW